MWPGLGGHLNLRSLGTAVLLRKVAFAHHVGHSCITFVICVEGWPFFVCLFRGSRAKMILNSARCAGVFFGNFPGGETDIENICLQDTTSSWLAVSNIFLMFTCTWGNDSV